jgi:hypothetical protein
MLSVPRAIYVRMNICIKLELIHQFFCCCLYTWETREKKKQHLRLISCFMLMSTLSEMIETRSAHTRSKWYLCLVKRSFLFARNYHNNHMMHTRFQFIHVKRDLSRLIFSYTFVFLSLAISIINAWSICNGN